MTCKKEAAGMKLINFRWRQLPRNLLCRKISCVPWKSNSTHAFEHFSRAMAFVLLSRSSLFYVLLSFLCSTSLTFDLRGAPHFEREKNIYQHLSCLRNIFKLSCQQEMQHAASLLSLSSWNSDSGFWKKKTLIKLLSPEEHL